MTHNGSDYEAVILQKLGAMEDILRSFMFSLKEPLQKEKGMSFRVEAPVDGKIRGWYLEDGAEVSWRELLCVIDSIRIPGDTRYILSPATGTLRILKWGEVSERDVIAIVKTTSNLV